MTFEFSPDEVAKALHDYVNRYHWNKPDTTTRTDRAYYTGKRWQEGMPRIRMKIDKKKSSPPAVNK